MILGTIGKAIGGVVAESVLDYLKTRKADQLQEAMQGEILEGWLYKLQIAIREEHRRLGVTREVHEAVIKRFWEVADKEFDTKKM